MCYAKEYKEEILGLPKTLIARDTAVSESVARAMAGCALERTNSDLALAITGVTGPDPDEDGNPVGLVHVAVARKPGRVLHVMRRFGPDTPGKIAGASLREALRLALVALKD